MSKPLISPADSGKKDIIKVLLVDDIPEARDGLRKLLAFENDIEVIGAASTGREGVQMAVDLKPDLILMDINMPDMDGIQATEQITKAVPTSAVVMMSVHKDAAYLRRAMLAGARDFLEKPISGEELYSTIRRVFELNSSIREQYRNIAQATAAAATSRQVDSSLMMDESGRLGHIVAVYSPQGGTGKTTLATNVAAALMREDTRVLLIDCDLQFGDVEVFLYLETKHTILDLADAVNDLDADLVENVLVTHASGLKVLTAPKLPTEAETITPDALREVIEKLAPNFDYTIVDMRVNLDEYALQVFDAAHRIVLVATPTLPSVKSSRRIFDIFDRLEYPRNKIIYVMNRVFDARDRSIIPLEAIESNLNRKIDVKIPLDEKMFLTSINQGVPVVAKGRTKSPAKEIVDMAEFIRQSLDPEEEEEPTKASANQKDGARRGRLRRG